MKSKTLKKALAAFSAIAMLGTSIPTSLLVSAVDNMTTYTLKNNVKVSPLVKNNDANITYSTENGIDKATVVFNKFSLDYVAHDDRPADGYWLGLHYVVPTAYASDITVSAANDSVDAYAKKPNIYYWGTTNGKENWIQSTKTVGNDTVSDATVWAPGSDTNYGANFTDTWDYINYERLFKKIAAGEQVTFKYKIDWDRTDATTGDQIVEVTYKPEGVTLGSHTHNDNESTYYYLGSNVTVGTETTENAKLLKNTSGFCNVCGKTVSSTEASTTNWKSEAIAIDSASNTKFTLTVTGDDSAKLTISPVDSTKGYEFASYKVNNELADFIGFLADNVVKTGNGNGNAKVSTEELIATINEVEIQGVFKAVNPINIAALSRLELDGGMLKVDCRNEDGIKDEFKKVTGAANTEVQPYSGSTADSYHAEFTVNTTYHNHKCKNEKCGAVFNDISAHDFKGETAKVDKTKNIHTCACGATTDDFKPTDKQVKAYKQYKLDYATWETNQQDNGNQNQNQVTAPVITADVKAVIDWNKQHEWGENNTTNYHKCTKCGVDMRYDHTEVMKSTSKTTHAVTCEECELEITKAENHTYEPHHSNSVSDKGTDEYAVACDGCSAKHEDGEHSYTYVWTKVSDNHVNRDANNNSNSPVTADYEYLNWELKSVGTASGLVCACGAVKEHKHTTTVDNENHAHYCGCGYVIEGEHRYTKCYDETGKLVTADAAKAVVCADCGAVKSGNNTHGALDHSNANDLSTANDVKVESTYYDTVENKHYCYCGKEITGNALATYHNANGENADFTIDTVNHKHLCKLCGMDVTLAANAQNAVGVSHVYNHVAIVPGTNASGYYTEATNAMLLTKPQLATAFKTSNNATLWGSDNSNGFGLYCECGELNPEHKTHTYELGVNGENHYCKCGAKESNPKHTYTNGVCSTCGKATEHNHTFSTVNCICTFDGCNVAEHDPEIVGSGENRVHRCKRCGKEVGQITLADKTNPIHEFKVDGDKHVCDCGLENPDTINSTNGHIFGTRGEAIHECQVEGCNYNKHDISGNCVNQIHTCSCGFKHSEDTGHEYDPSTDKCIDSTCGKLNPNHKHTVSTFGRNGDVCRCGEEIEHVLVPEDNTNHKCSNVEQTALVNDVDKSQSVENVKDGQACSLGDDKHYFGKNDISCVCGYVNPELLKDVIPAGIIVDNVTYNKNADGDSTNTTIASLLSSGGYTTAYISNLEAAAKRLYSYNYNLTLDGDVKTVTTASDEADFETALNAYTALYEKLEDNQAAGGANIYAIVSKDKDGNDLPTGITLNNSVTVNGFTYGTVTGQYGSKINLAEAITIEPGYKFAGWFYDKEGKKPVSENANYEITVSNGYRTFYAKAEAKTDVASIELPGNIKYNGSITGEGIYANNGSTRRFIVGEKVTLKLNANLDDGFLYLKDSQGTTHEISTTSGYTFTVTGPESFTYVTYKVDNTGRSVYARFMSDDTDYARVYAYGDAPYESFTNKTFDLQAVLDNAGVSNPTKAGYKFEGWLGDNERTYTVSGLSKAVITDATAIKLTPIFTAEKYTITLKGGSFISSAHEALNKGEGFATGTRIGLTADAMKGGKYFSGWYVNGVKVVETRTFYYVVSSDGAQVEAKYEGTEPLVEKTKISISSSRTLADSANPTGKQVVSLISNREVASGNKVVEVGFIYSSKGAVDGTTVLDNVNGSTIKKASKAFDTRLGSYQIDIGLSSAPNATVTARAYVTYVDANGEQQTVYSDGVLTSTSADLAK